MLYFYPMLSNSHGPLPTKFGPLEKLERSLHRHQCHPWRRPPAAFSLELWRCLETWRHPTRALFLDLGCGRGLATRQLAERFPEAQVLGIDKSAHRLRDAPPLSPEMALVRGELQDLVPLMVQAGWKAEQVYVLYPNPWPKSTQAKRRWPHHPLFPLIVRLGPLEMRTNWELYAQEWAQACRILGIEVEGPHPLEQPSWPTTSFEKKYRAQGLTLWKVNSHG